MRELQTITGQGKRNSLAWYEAIIERDLDLKVLEVTKAAPSGSASDDTNLLGFIADFGGLFVLLYLIFLGLTSLITSGKMETYLVSELFRRPASNDSSFGDMNSKEK